MAVRIDRLKNGITVATDSMPDLESAALGVWVRVGSRYEAEREHGISHFLEHMAFKGTKTRSARAIAEEIEAVGGEVNASTSVENTSYYARVLADDVPLAIDILADILQNSSFDGDEMRREKSVILQEIGAAFDTPDDLVFDRFLEAAWPGQPVGRPILGTPDTVRSFERDNLESYLDRYYGGSSMIVAASGRVDHEAIADLVTDRFQTKGNGSVPGYPRAAYRGGDARAVKDLMEAQVVLGFEGHSYENQAHFCPQLVASMLGGGMSSRLFQEVREKRGLCYAIYAFHWAFSDTGIFGIHAATGGDEVDELMAVILDEIERAIDGFEQHELDRAKAQLRAGLMMALESPSARAGTLARQILLYGRAIPREEIIERIDSLSLDDVRTCAAGLVTGSQPTLAAIGPVEGLRPHEAIADRFLSTVS
ncbi:MAG: pitrilysin family protein [Pseudomonadota bacterium]